MGQPVKRAMILFTPVSEGLSACGAVVDGMYTSLTTHDQNDGIHAGKYKVALIPCPDAPPPPPAPAQPAPPPNGQVLTSHGKPVPERYTDLDRSNLKIEVTSNVVAADFELHD